MTEDKKENLCTMFNLAYSFMVASNLVPEDKFKRQTAENNLNHFFMVLENCLDNFSGGGKWDNRRRKNLV